MSDWWGRHLAQPASPGTRAVPSPARVPVAPAPHYPPVPAAAPSKARSAAQNDMCPDCGSGNYFQATPQVGHRCYDCGYPLVQAGSGRSSSAISDGPAQPARQVSTKNNFQPQTIIGRVD